MTHRVVRRALGGSVGLVATVILVGSAVPAAAEDDPYPYYPDLIVSAQFDQPAYESDDVIEATVTITNVGNDTAVGVTASTDWVGNTLWLQYPWWGDLDDGTVHLEPGASHVAHVRGMAGDPASGVVRFVGRVATRSFESDIDDNTFSISAPVRMTRGDVGGTVIDDKNGNGVADPGEGVPNVHVLVSGGNPYDLYERLTDSQGRFLFEDLPTGTYRAGYYSDDGWVVGPEYPNEESWEVGEAGLFGLTVLAVRPLSDTLLVTAEFTEQTYQVGDEAHVALTIRNRTGTTVTGIHAHCNGVGNANQFNGVGPGWAPFDQTGPGTTLAAGETRTFDVYEPVPDGAPPYGYVGLACEIGPGAGTGVRGLPFAVDRAKVPGMFTTVSARIVYDAEEDGAIEDEGIPDTRVTLLDYGTHNVVARAVSDAQGRFQFTDIPTGRYVLDLVGPWVPQGSQSMILQAFPPQGFPFEHVFGMEPRHA